jgi:hypothetical protein
MLTILQHAVRNHPQPPVSVRKGMHLSVKGRKSMHGNAQGRKGLQAPQRTFHAKPLTPIPEPEPEPEPELLELLLPWHQTVRISATRGYTSSLFT